MALEQVKAFRQKVARVEAAANLLPAGIVPKFLAAKGCQLQSPADA